MSNDGIKPRLIADIPRGYNSRTRRVHSPLAGGERNDRPNSFYSTMFSFKVYVLLAKCVKSFQYKIWGAAMRPNYIRMLHF